MSNPSGPLKASVGPRLPSMCRGFVAASVDKRRLEAVMTIPRIAPGAGTRIERLLDRHAGGAKPISLEVEHNDPRERRSAVDRDDGSVRQTAGLGSLQQSGRHR